MGITSPFRRARMLVILIAIFFISGCLEENLVYPEIISGNTFKLTKRWEGKYIRFVEVYGISEDSGTLLEPT